MPRTHVRTRLEYRRLESVDDLFLDGTPNIVCRPHKRLYLSRDFDLLVIFSILLGFMSIVGHVLYNMTHKPEAIPQSSWVKTKCALLDGVVNKEQDVFRFWSVPYAAPPVRSEAAAFPMMAADIVALLGMRSGGLRWYKPLDISQDEFCLLSYDKKRCTYTDGRWQCKMTKPDSEAVCTELKENGENAALSTENCLTLDIVAPMYEGELMPVVVVMSGFHGLVGPTNPNKMTESAYAPTDDVTRFYKAVWVTVRYRLGPLGSFYDLNQINPDNKTSRAGYTNFGLHDQIAALRWVKEQIELFGGDPNRVTLLGHGSGATGGLALIGLAGLDHSTMLFQSAWLASGSANWVNLKDLSGKIKKFQPNTFMKRLEPQLIDPTDRSRLGVAVDANGDVNLPMERIRRRLNGISEVNLRGRIKSYYKEIEWLRSITEPKDKTVGHWYSIDADWDLPSPNRWTPDLAHRAFKRTGKNNLKALAFTSMQSEFEAIIPTDSVKVGNIRNQLDDVGFTKNPSIAERERNFVRTYLEWIKTNIYNLQGHDDTETILNVLSTARVTCPQAWLIDRWLALLGQPSGDPFSQHEDENSPAAGGRTRFYQVYYDQQPIYPVNNVPGVNTEGLRRLPFNGLDMLVLTGNYPNKMRSFENTLRESFKKFVHNQTLSDDCRATESKGKTFTTGCVMGSQHFQAIPTSDAMPKFCHAIDWEKEFENIALKQ